MTSKLAPSSSAAGLTFDTLASSGLGHQRRELGDGLFDWGITLTQGVAQASQQVEELLDVAVGRLLRGHRGDGRLGPGAAEAGALRDDGHELLRFLSGLGVQVDAQQLDFAGRRLGFALDHQVIGQ